MIEQFTFSVFWIALTLSCFLLFAKTQAWSKRVWLNPMLLCVLTLIALLVIFDIDYQIYQNSTQYLSMLLEPAIVALGFPLYQQIHAIRRHWKIISLGLICGAVFIISLSFMLTQFLVGIDAVSVSIALKSITTPIGLALTEQLNGNAALTAFAIILAGLFGAIWGISWLELFKVKSPKAQGLAIGAASHALGTATISQISYQHAAYSSLALIISATITAFTAPTIINLLRIFSL